MSEAGGEIPQQQVPKLSKIEGYQAFKPDRVTSREAVMALSAQVTANPELHRQVAENPYSAKAQTLIAERFGDQDPSDVVRAVIFAEPEGIYEQEHKMNPLAEQKERLYRQIDTSADMLVNLSRYVNTHVQELWTMSPERIYQTLSQEAFGTTNPKDVETDYAQSQRRGFRLGIVNFIEGIAKLKPHADAFATDAKGTAQEILGKDLSGDVKVESLPVGFVMYLNENDFAKALEKRNMNVGNIYGVVLHEEEVSSDLDGRVVLVKTGSPDEQGTRNHEVEHMVFHTFLQEESSEFFVEPLLQARNVEDYRKVASQFKKSIHAQGRDEILAYMYNNNVDELSFGSLNIDRKIANLNPLWGHLWRDNNLTPSEKTEVYLSFREQTVLAVEQLRRYQWVKDALFKEAGKEGSSLTREKVQALVEFTPVDQVGRLSRYLGFTEANVEQQYQDYQKRDAEGWKDFLARLPVSSEDPTVKTRESMREAFEAEVTSGRKGLLPGLLQEIQTTQDEAIVGFNVDIIAEMVYAQIHSLSFAELDEIQRTLKEVLVKRGETQVGAEDQITKIIRNIIDGPIKMEHVDFVHNPPEWLNKEQETTESTEKI